MILTLGNKKGGVGKSTSTVYLAAGLARRGRTLIVDADPQGSILSWSEEAGEGFPAAVVQWSTRDLARRVQDVAGDYAHIVIDTGRAATEDDPILRQALMVSDHLLVPFAPSLMDVRELGRVLQLVEDLETVHHVDAHLLLTKVRGGTASSRDAREGITGQGLPLLNAQIGLREAYANVWGTVITDLLEYDAVLDELIGARV
ncbi:MAG: AAA family ATPase [Propionibacteriaceae bacterium]